jgi:hypothetical protein
MLVGDEESILSMETPKLDNHMRNLREDSNIVLKCVLEKLLTAYRIRCVWGEQGHLGCNMKTVSFISNC